MELTTLARPYAKALFDLAGDGKGYAHWSQQLAALSALAANPEMQAALRLPGVSKSQRAALLLEGLKGQLDTEGTALVKVLADYGRLLITDAIAVEFERLRAEVEARVHVEITTAAAVGDSEKGKLSTAVSNKLQRAVDISWDIDESLIAGALIRAGDLVIDGSAAGELARLKAALTC